MAKLWFGGSFNPIHHAHLICSRAVAEAAGFDRVVLVPSAQPPHKPDSAILAPAADRLAMTRLAVAGDPLFEVDDLELSRTGPSYTLDTARELVARGEGPVSWLIGADMLLILPTWHRPQELLREVHFVVMARPGSPIDWTKLPSEFQHLQQNVIEAPLISISATEIRKRVKEGRSIRCLTPEPVMEYIRERGLYR